MLERKPKMLQAHPLNALLIDVHPLEERLEDLDEDVREAAYGGHVELVGHLVQDGCRLLHQLIMRCFCAACQLTRNIIPILLTIFSSVPNHYADKYLRNRNDISSKRK